MNNESKKKKRNKKNKNANQDIEPQEAITETSQNTKPTIIDFKQYIKQDLLESTSQMKLKPLIEMLSKAYQLKDDQSSAQQIYELYRTIQNQKIQSQIEAIQSKVELVYLEKDKQTAKEKHDAVLKKAQDKDKFQQMLVDKGNKMNQDKMDLIKAANDERTNLIKEAEEYAQSLQKMQEDSLPERALLIEENNRLRKEIENCLLDSMKMKEEFDNKIRENEAKFAELTNKGGIEKLMNSFTTDAQKYIMENQTLKTEIATYEQKTEEILKIKEMGEGELQKIKDEVNKKKDEAILLGTENAEIRSRLKKKKNGSQEEIIALFKQYETGKSKLSMMESLNKKYKEQYAKLYEDKFPSVNVIKEDEKYCGHDHGHGHEHCNGEEGHEHEHHHQHSHNQIEDNGDTHFDNTNCCDHYKPELQLSNNNNTFKISNANKLEITNETGNNTNTNIQENTTNKDTTTTIDSSSQVKDDDEVKAIEDKAVPEVKENNPIE